MMELFVNQTRLVKHKDEMSANVCYTYKLQNDTQFSVSSENGTNAMVKLKLGYGIKSSNVYFTILRINFCRSNRSWFTHDKILCQINM